MRGKTVIRCGDCGVGSDKKIILVYHGIRKCQNCAAMEAMSMIAAQKPMIFKKLTVDQGAGKITPEPGILANANDGS